MTTGGPGPPDPREATMGTRFPALGHRTYPWADLVIDTAARARKQPLPATLPAPEATVTGTSSNHQARTGTAAQHLGRISLHRLPGTDWGAPGRVNLVLVTTLPGDLGHRTAVVTDQSARAPGLATLAGVFPNHYPQYLFPDPDPDPDPHRATQHEAYQATARTEWYAHLAAVTDWLRHGPLAAEAPGWSVPATRAWLQWFAAGVTSPTDRQRLEAVGVGLGTRDKPLWQVCRLRDVGLPLEEVLAWLPHLRAWSTGPAEAAALHRLRFADIAPYLGTGLDPTDPRVTNGTEVDDRVAAIRATLDAGWTAQGRAAVDASTPAGCTSTTWASLWAEFMPVALASAYAAAGFSFTEAVRLHLRGEDPDPATLAMLAGLQPGTP